MNETSNPFAIATQPHQPAAEIVQTRASAEVQSAMIIAKKFPRDENRAIERIRQSCTRRSLAEVACYAYPRGGTTVTGPSIRLAECLAQSWGNLDFGILELEQRNGESTVMAFCWDLETNTREHKIFQVKHERHTKAGVVKLEDVRDIYEVVANQGARRLRSCILGIIPGDVVDIAVEQVEKTLSQNTEPLIDRGRKMAAAFSEFGVTLAMLEKRLGHKLDAIIEAELVTLRKIYTSLRDGAAKREDFFDVAALGEPGRPQFDDTAAESAAGLAPAPASSPEPKGKRARAAGGQTTGGAAASPVAAVAPASQAPASENLTPPPAASAPASVNAPGTVAPPSTPAPVVSTPASPTQSAATPAAATAFDSAETPGTEPSDNDGATGELFASPAYNQLVGLMAERAITADEVIELCRKRKVMSDDQSELAQLSDEKINDIIGHIDVVVSAIKIERRAKQGKK